MSVREAHHPEGLVHPGKSGIPGVGESEPVEGDGTAVALSCVCRDPREASAFYSADALDTQQIPGEQMVHLPEWSGQR